MSQGSFSSAISSQTLTLNPTAKLAPLTTYTIKLPEGALKTRSGVLSRAFTLSFTTGEPPKLTVQSTSPTDGAIKVALKPAVTIVYNLTISSGKDVANIVFTSADGKAVRYGRSISSKTLTLTPTSNLAFGTAYTITIPKGAIISTVDKISTAADFTIKFKTKPKSAH
jgi:hypothetical protein